MLCAILPAPVVIGNSSSSKTVLRLHPPYFPLHASNERLKYET